MFNISTVFSPNICDLSLIKSTDAEPAGMKGQLCFLQDCVCVCVCLCTHLSPSLDASDVICAQGGVRGSSLSAFFDEDT